MAMNDKSDAARKAWAMSASRFVGIGLAGAVLGLTLTGWGHPTTPASPVPLVAHVDPTAGTITLPLDRYDASDAQFNVVATANSLAMSRCMASAGAGSFWRFYDSRRPTQDVDRRYGIWVKAQVTKYGYGQPPPDAVAKKLQAANSIKFTPGADAAYKKCIGVVHAQGLAFATPPDDSSSGDADTTPDTSDTSAAKAIVKQWKSCLQNHDVPMPDAGNPWVPAGVLGTPLEEQIRIGLIDVDCKAQVNLVQRLADLEAEAQGPYLARHEASLVAIRQDAERATRTARAYLAAHPAQA